jgi:hypothetical protein
MIKFTTEVYKLQPTVYSKEGLRKPLQANLKKYYEKFIVDINLIYKEVSVNDIRQLNK